MSFLFVQDLDAARDGKVNPGETPGVRKLRVMHMHMKLKQAESDGCHKKIYKLLWDFKRATPSLWATGAQP